MNDTCPGCVDHSKGMFSSYSMGIGGPADNFVPAMSYWAQPHPHVRAACLCCVFLWKMLISRWL